MKKYAILRCFLLEMSSVIAINPGKKNKTYLGIPINDPLIAEIKIIESIYMAYDKRIFFKT